MKKIILQCQPSKIENIPQIYGIKFLFGSKGSQAPGFINFRYICRINSLEHSYMSEGYILTKSLDDAIKIAEYWTYSNYINSSPNIVYWIEEAIKRENGNRIT